MVKQGSAEQAKRGKAWSGRAGKAWHRGARQSGVKQLKAGKARLGTAWIGVGRAGKESRSAPSGERTYVSG